MTQIGQALKRPSYQFELVYYGWVVFFICKVRNYLTSHFDLQIMNHLISQIVI
jgi:hypothetical protein